MQNTEDEALNSLTVELADTRPAMIWLPLLGALPIEAAALVLGLFGEAMVVTRDWALLVPAPIVWWVASRLISLDYHAFTQARLWLATSAWTFDAKPQGGASASPYPLHRKRPRGIA